jgi:hypothetical protein
MNAPAGGVTLAPLDDASPLNPDSKVWQCNLSAWRAVDAPSAAVLERMELPAAWRAVQALDDEPTWRLEPAGTRPEWLGGSAVPVGRAAALLEGFQTGGANATLPGIGTGAELALLLAGLPAHTAVFVFEADWRRVAAVLRVRDLADALRRRQCVLVPPTDARGWLRALLTEHAGLLPPGNILRLPDASAAQVEAVRVVVQQVNDDAARQRQQRLTTVLAAPRSAPSATARLAIVSLAPDSRAQAAARALSTAAEGAGWPILHTGVSGPLDAHLLVHAERLAAFAPTTTVGVAHGRPALPAALLGRWCVWHLGTADVPEQVEPDGTLRLAASPTVAAALRAAGAAEAELHPLYWACEPEALPEPSDTVGTEVLLLGDLPDDSAAGSDVRLPTHTRLWEQLQRVLAERWAAPRVLPAEGALRSAEQASNARVGAPALRQRFLRLIDAVLRPAAVLRQLCAALSAAGQRVAVAGRGWERLDATPVARWGTDADQVAGDAGTPPPRAIVIAGRSDPLGPDVLAAAARGWPLWMHAPQGAAVLATALGGVLVPDQHVRVFREARTLVTGLLAETPTVMKWAQRAATHVGGRHSYAQRLASAAAWIGPGPATGNS